MTMHSLARRSLIPLCFLVSTLAASSNAWAWLSTGHRIIAAIAWDDLTPATRAKVTAMLKQHPRYEKDLLIDKPDTMIDDAEVAHYAFDTAATWPDMVRSFSNPMHAGYSHPNWHYIDTPYVLGGQKVPPQTDPSATGPQNIIEALTKNVADARDPKLSVADKAVALCWILHLCGDIHQPLHAIEMFSPELPSGDQGGNAEIILRTPPYADTKSNLHMVWDSLPGDYDDRVYEGYLADGLRNDPQYSRGQLKDKLAQKDFAAWASESHELAIKYAYLNGDLKFALNSSGGGTGGNGANGGPSSNSGGAVGTNDAAIPGLPRGYLAAAEQIARERIVLSGYRMADLLNSIFDSR